MSPLTKYADVPADAAKVLTPKEHQEIETELHKLGKTSAESLTPEERNQTFPPSIK